MKFLDPRTHGYFDYAAVVLLFLAPTLFGFVDTIPANLCYLIGVTQLLMSLATAYPLGAFKMIPFPVHGAIELLAAIFMIAAPWIMGFTDLIAARNLFVISGLFITGLWVVTSYTGVGTGVRRPYVTAGKYDR